METTFVLNGNDDIIINYITDMDLGEDIASYPGSNYAGEEKRAWYILLAHALSFARVRASE